MLRRSVQTCAVRLVLLGAPGSGKGTQGARLAAHFGVPHISSGDLLRAQVEAADAAGVMARGDLVSDDVVLAIVARAVADAPEGYVLDGFPRTVAQAELALARIPIDKVVALELPDAVARERLAGRATEGRTDDDRAVVDRRLAVYHEQTRPLLDYYRPLDLLVEIDASPPVDAVTDAILRALSA
jgi:adenylate kinase